MSPATRSYYLFLAEPFGMTSRKLSTISVPFPVQTTSVTFTAQCDHSESRHQLRSNACIRPVYRTSSSSIYRLLLCKAFFVCHVFDMLMYTLFPLLLSSRSALRIFIQHAGHLYGIPVVFICALRCSLCRIYTSLETYSTAKGAV